MTLSDVLFTDEFPPATVADWRRLVDKELRGADFETLVAPRPGGPVVPPLGVEVDGAVAASNRVSRWPDTWRVGVRLEAAEPAIRAQALQEALDQGAGLIWLTPPCPSLEAIDPRFVSLAFVGDENQLWNHLAWLNKRDLAQATGLVGRDPIATFIRRVHSQRLDKLYKPVAKRILRLEKRAPRLKGHLVDAAVFHEVGATGELELALMLASAVEALRHLEAAGVAPEQVARSSCFAVSVGLEIFQEIAKLRAARMLWRRVLETCGAGSEADAALWVGHGSRVSYTRRDRTTNTIRSSTQMFIAAVAGLDSLVLPPFDFACEQFGGDPTARRFALTAQHVLAEESHLLRVADPAAGSYALEALTATLAERAWSLFQQIEAEGGFCAAVLSYWISERIMALRRERRDSLRSRKNVVVGVTAFVDENEAVPPGRKYVRRNLPPTADLFCPKLMAFRAESEDWEHP